VALGASAAVDTAIAAGEEEPENRKKCMREDHNIGGTAEETYGDGRDKDNYGKEETRVDSEVKQLCDLSMEELNKRTDKAIEELDRGRARDLVAEISRRALSPDASAKSARANNLQLRSRIMTLEQEVKSLREEIKRHANKGNKYGGGKAIGKDPEWSQNSQISEEEAGMDWTTTDSGSNPNLINKQELNNIIPEVTKRVVAAVDVTLARFVERLIPLEHSVTRILENKKVMENERNIISDGNRESGRRGKKRRTEEALSPVPLSDSQYNKERQLGRSRTQPLPADAGIPDVGEKRSTIQNVERSIRNGNTRVREPNAIVVIKIKEDSETSYRALMTELRKEINPERDLGIKKLSVHKAKSGCRIARITGEDAERQADQLNKIKESTKKYGDHVSVYKPGLGGSNQLHFEVGGSDDTITEDEVKKQIRESVEGREEEFKFNRFSYTSRGWRMIFSCTKNKGNRLLDRGYVKVGWSRVGVRLLPRARIRCHKCLKTGHTIGSCAEERDRGRRCFNCGNTGHSAGQCAMEAGCPLCRDLGLESTHKLGNFRCAYPSFPTRWETANNNRYGSNLTVNNRYGSNLTVNFEGGAFDGRRSYARPGKRGG